MEHVVSQMAMDCFRCRYFLTWCECASPMLTTYLSSAASIEIWVFRASSLMELYPGPFLSAPYVPGGECMQADQARWLAIGDLALLHCG